VQHKLNTWLLAVVVALQVDEAVAVARVDLEPLQVYLLLRGQLIP
jgi:hypothetical protein